VWFISLPHVNVLTIIVAMEDQNPRLKDDFSPKQVALALGVSESSLKRWCDRGLLPMHRTAGGHRRLLLADVLQFVRGSKQRLVSPELIGLMARVGQEDLTVGRAFEKVVLAFSRGDQATAVAVGLGLYGGACQLSTIFDQVYAPALHAIGEQWACKTIEVYQERRSIVITMQVLAEVRRLLAAPAADAPLALGATCEGDIYTVSITMGELVLREAGWNALSLGSNIPLSSITQAVAVQRPKLLWLSFSHIEDVDTLAAGMLELVRTADECGTSIVVGGQALDETVRKKLGYTAFCEDLSHLSSLAKSLWHRGNK
jgi:MerR family transcriptional regulator, light-induced transcriptional regulator